MVNSFVTVKSLHILEASPFSLVTDNMIGQCTFSGNKKYIIFYVTSENTAVVIYTSIYII